MYSKIVSTTEGGAFGKRKHEAVWEERKLRMLRRNQTNQSINLIISPGTLNDALMHLLLN